MFKSILAVSEGGPDALMTFSLARRLAGIFDGTVDALHLPVGAIGGTISLHLATNRHRLETRARQSEQVFKEILGPLAGSTYTAEIRVTPLEALVGMGRFSDILVLGRPGADPENHDPDTVKTAIYECARAVMIAPPDAVAGPFESVIVAWNASFQATRAVEYAMPFLAKASKITILVVGKQPDEVGASFLARNFQRHGLKTVINAVDPGTVSGRARGRALLDYAHGTDADLLVMGAYGGGQLKSFLGVGGATGKVLSSCRIPVLMAH